MDNFKVIQGAVFEVTGGIFGSVRTLKKPSHMRLRWEDSDWPKKTIVQIYILSRPKDKCMFGITHEHLANPRIKERQRLYWKNVVEKLVLALSVTSE